MVSKLFLAMILLICFSSATQNLTADSTTPPTAGADKAGGELSAAFNRFGINLLNRIVETDFGENIFISPASAAMALAMVLNGAEGQTEIEMAKALELSAMPLDLINQSNLELNTLLVDTDSLVELAIANSLWLRQGFDFKEAFLGRNEKYYKAEIRNLDFANPASADKINGWVSDKTRGKIDKIVGRINEQDLMFLLNAVYFKGIWKYRFDEEQTSEMDFALLDGTKKRHPLMSQSGRFDYSETGQFQAIRLPYGEGRFSMLVFLPKPEYGLDKFRDDINDSNWQLWLNGLTSREGTIMLPRFKMEYDRVLNNPLKELGMETAFDRVKADFTGMWEAEKDTNVFIQEVRQKTFLEVNEKGTEAAAVTSVRMALYTSSVNDAPERFMMIVDRPFFCAIRDEATGLILFLGTIVDPQSA